MSGTHTTVAFVGLGIMGAPMAANLIKAGFDVIGHNRSPAPVQALVRRGGRAAGSLAEVVCEADVVITMLPGSPDVERVVTGPDGVLEHSHAGQLVIDMSTIRPDVSRRIASAAAEVGVSALDAPVSGGEAGAIEGNLSIMVGADEADFEAALPVFEALGSTIVHVGPAGAGQTVKAANQLIVAGNIQLLAEAIVFLEAADVDTERGLKVLGGGLAGSTVLDRKAEAMRTREFTPGFRLAMHHKDLGIAIATARETGVVIPLGSAVAQLVAALFARGDGHLDHCALLKLTAELSGRPCRPTEHG